MIKVSDILLIVYLKRKNNNKKKINSCLKNESDKEEMQKKFDQIKKLFSDMTTKAASASTAAAGVGTNDSHTETILPENLDNSLIRDLQTKFNEFEKSNIQSAQDQNADLNNDFINDVRIFFFSILIINYFKTAFV